MTSRRVRWGRRSRSRKAFTLIELLVVVAIIALLISILLPSLAAARSQAKTVKCMAQLRQFGNAAAYYASEQGDYLPGDRGMTWLTEQEGPHVLFAEVLAPYLGGSRGRLTEANQMPRGDARDCVLAQVFQQMKVARCPAWPTGSDGVSNNCPTGSTGGGSGRGGRGGGSGGASGPPNLPITEQPLTYVVNAWDIITEKQSLGPDGYYTQDDGPAHGRGTIKLSQVPRPGSMIFLTEASRNGIGWKAYNFHDMWQKVHLWNGADPRMISDLRHSGGRGTSLERARANVLYVDSHVATERLAQITASDFSPYQLPPGATRQGGGGRGRGSR